MKPSMLSVKQCAERLGMSEQYVRRQVASGALPASKVGRWRVDADDLEAFIAAQRPTPTAPVSVHEPDALPRLERNPFL